MMVYTEKTEQRYSQDFRPKPNLESLVISHKSQVFCVDLSLLDS
jgi:hypothetical protein